MARMIAVCALLVAFSGATAMAASPFNKSGGSSTSGVKYVFFFLGDGMASVQIDATETYQASLVNPSDTAGGIKKVHLDMTQFPVLGICTTYDYGRQITDSASAGTAFSCGMKTKDGVIAMDPAGKVAYTSIAKLAKSKGMKVGIISSVSIDHATPAVYYANQPSRNSYHDIAMQIPASEFDYFGGGGFKAPDGPDGNVFDALTAAGYSIATTRDQLNALAPGTKAVAYNNVLDSSKALYYDMDRPADHISLREFTAKGIELLDNPSGFFMMVEGGKIDWACHANDAKATLTDVIAFDDAVQEAINFMAKHPNETLIVVTGDHETGGMTIGFAGTQYDTAFELLKNQTKSFDAFTADFKEYKKTSSWAGEQDNIDATLITMIYDSFGIVYQDLTDYQKEQLEDSFDRSMKGEAIKAADEDYLLYGGYEPLVVTLTHLLDQMAGIAWTTYAHTGVPVPVMAKGVDSTIFAGFYDNTDLAKKLATVMNVTLNNN